MMAEAVPRSRGVSNVEVHDPSRFLIRRALPAAILITLLTGWARWFASDRGLIDETTGVAIMTTLAVVVLSGISVWSARKLGAATVELRAIDRAALYRTLAENYPGGAIFLFDFDLRYLLVAGENLAEVGLVPDELEGRTIWEALDPATCAQIEPVYRAALAGERTSLEMMFRDQHYLVTVAPTTDDHGTVTGGLVQTQQITTQKHLEEQLHQSQKLEAIGQLAGGVAHDFNNLLTVIKGYTTLALPKLEQEHPFRHSFEAIDGAADSAASLTRQLLAFSRKQVLEPQLLDVGQVVDHVHPMLERLIESRIRLRISIDRSAPPILFDRGQLEQVLINLAINARDAIPGSGTISIEVGATMLDKFYADSHQDAEAGPHVVISVSDTGHGMDEDTRARIFEPFFTTKLVGEGTGLGLSTVHGIVKQSGGNIWVYSELGHGTTFKIYVPAADVKQEGGVAPSVETHTPNAAPFVANATVLVVDDHVAVSQLTAEILEEAGYRVVQVSSATAAAEALGERAVDVVLSDIVMPGGNGQAPAYPHDVRGTEPRIVYMSGYTADVVSQRDLMAVGMRFLEKPFSPAALLGAVAAVLNDR